MKVVASFIENGWPRHERSVPHSVRDYFRERSSLSISDGLITYKLQIVVPPNMRAYILQRLHETHQGISKCRERAAAYVSWPGIGKEIIALVERCETCQRNRPAQREQPLHPTELPKLPWQKIAMDICQHNRKDYLVIIDYYSRWVEIKQLVDESNIGICHQSCQSCLHYARRSRCRRIGQWPTIRVGRVQTLCRRDVFHSTDNKSVLRTRERHGRTGRGNGETDPRFGRPRNWAVELSSNSSQCNRCATVSGSDGALTGHTIAGR